MEQRLKKVSTNSGVRYYEPKGETKEILVGFRKCLFCGGMPNLYMTRNGKYGMSGFIKCEDCGCKSSHVWGSEKEIRRILKQRWNRCVYDSEIKYLNHVNKELTETIGKLEEQIERRKGNDGTEKIG